MIFLIEANEKYIDELQKFKDEVLQADKDNDDQFAGCMGLRDCSTSKEWISDGRLVDPCSKISA